VSDPSIRSDVEAVCDFEDRLTGTDAERRASLELAARLSTPGRTSTTESTYVQPQWAVVHLLHCAIAAIGSMISGFAPAAGFALVLLAATSAYLDLTGRHYLLRRLPFRRASQNVISWPQANPPGATRLILCANLDAPRTGAAYNRLPVRIANAASRRMPIVSSPTRIWFWSIALLLPALGARMAGIDANWVAALQLPQTLILIVSSFLLGEIALSPASPGANANASGVAAVLQAVRRLDADPPQRLAVGALVCGAGETTMQGMRAYLRAHRKELDRARTWFISLESVGRGDVRFISSQGLAVTLPMDSYLLELCEAIALADEGEVGARPIRNGGISAAVLARSYKYPAVAITCREGDEAFPLGHHTPSDTPEEIDPVAIERASAFVVNVVRLLDRDLARRGAKEAAPAVAPQEAEREAALRPA
jgi:hypothetical protein